VVDPTLPYTGPRFAAYPIDLPLRCIAAGCKPGGIVLDPFAGSRTTGLAAIQLDRRFTGIDLSPDFAQFAAGRLARRSPTGRRARDERQRPPRDHHPQRRRAGHHPVCATGGCRATGSTTSPTTGAGSPPNTRSRTTVPRSTWGPTPHPSPVGSLRPKPRRQGTNSPSPSPPAQPQADLSPRKDARESRSTTNPVWVFRWCPRTEAYQLRTLSLSP
jgi:hypothetical protein